MVQGKCLLCFTLNRQSFNILNTHLQQVLEKIIDSKIEAESISLCFICHKRMQQCYQLMQLAKTSQCYLNTIRTEKVDVNLKKHQPLLELTTSKMVNTSFSQFESYIETNEMVKKEYLNVDEMEQQENYDESSECTQGVTDDQLQDISSEHDDQQNVTTWIKTEIEEVAIDYEEMEHQENFDESLECTPGVTDKPITDVNSEHDDQKHAPTWIKTEIEELPIDYEGEINIENDEQVTSADEDNSSKDDYRPDFSNIVTTPDTENANEEESNILITSKVHASVPEKVKICKYCPYVTKQKSHMVRHQRIHTGEKPFICDVCKRSFSQKHAMLEHRRTHTGEKPFSCDICERKFTCSRNLKGHMRSHYEKPFSCDLCDRKYSQKSNLIVHQRSHTGEKPFVCEVCEKGFTRKCYLYDHRITHSDTKPFSCDICQDTFSRISLLRKHKVVHTDESTCRITDKIV